MKIKELVQCLHQFDEGMEVLVEGYEQGVEPLDKERIKKIKYTENVHKQWYYGRHEKDKNGKHEGILLRRKTESEQET
ncbi:MAG: hypothetical protein QME32_04450 [Endomicrobiia bacterium]|nr:hypothetical protein [Endomicrobiia bacterium]